MSRFRVIHETTYTYKSRVTSSYGQLCLLPRDFDGQRCITSTIDIDPAPSDHRDRVDWFGNRVAYFTLQRPHHHLRIRATSEVEVAEAREWSSDLPVAQAQAALATMSGNKKGRGNKASADKIVNARKSSSGYSKAIWLQIAKDLGAKIKSNVNIKHAQGTKAKQGLKPTTILEVLGLEQAHIDEVMQTGLNKAVPVITKKMIDRIEWKMAKLAAKKSGKRR